MKERMEFLQYAYKRGTVMAELDAKCDVIYVLGIVNIVPIVLGGLAGIMICLFQK